MMEFTNSAEVFAADAFQTHFAENPRSLEAWSKFREEILEKGGSQNELGMMTRFLNGRSIDPGALLSMLDGASSQI